MNIDECPHFNENLRKHLALSRKIAKHLVKIGKDETSVIIEHKVDIEDCKAKIKTTLTLLPIRRIYKAGSEIVGDSDLLHEMLESDLL